MKVLVTAASKHGSTYQIAETICKVLREAQLDAELKDAGSVVTLAGYDAVVLGSAVYAGNWLPDAKAFAERHQAALAKLPVWVFSSGPLGAENPQPRDDVQKLAAPLGAIRPRDHRVFVGKLDPHDLGLSERLIAKAVHAPSGDFRDWPAIKAWAQTIATELAQQPQPAT